jgi:hypothetical protein
MLARGRVEEAPRWPRMTHGGGGPPWKDGDWRWWTSRGLDHGYRVSTECLCRRPSGSTASMLASSPLPPHQIRTNSSECGDGVEQVSSSLFSVFVVLGFFMGSIGMGVGS